MNTLLNLEESRLKAKERFKHQQDIVKKWFNKRKFGNRRYEVGYLVLKWDHPHDEKGSILNFNIYGLAHFRLLQN